MKVYGKKNLVRKGAVIFAPNHQHWMDCMYLLFKVPRKSQIIGKIEIRQSKFLNFLAWGFRCPLFDRKNPTLGFFREVDSILKKERALGIFPEGTRRENENEALEAKGGVAFFAIKHDTWVQPMAIEKKCKAFKRNRLIIGEAYKIEKKEGVGTKELIAISTKELSVKIEELYAQFKAMDDAKAAKKNKK